MSQRRPVCEYYLKDMCYFGDRCRFSHVGVGYFEGDDSSDEECDGPLPPSNRRVRVISDGDYKESGHGGTYGGAKYRFSDDERGPHGAEKWSSYEQQQLRSDVHRKPRDHPDRRESPSRTPQNSQSEESEEDSEDEDLNSSSRDVRRLVKHIKEEAKQVAEAHMWPLTSLSVLKYGSNVPGWVDHSPEELRLAAYSAKAVGRLDQFHDFHHCLLRDASKIRNTFLRRTKEAEKLVQHMLDPEVDDPRGAKASTTFVTSIPAFCFFGSAASPPFGLNGVPSSFGETVETGVSSGGCRSEKDPKPGLFARSLAASKSVFGAPATERGSSDGNRLENGPPPGLFAQALLAPRNAPSSSFGEPASAGGCFGGRRLDNGPPPGFFAQALIGSRNLPAILVAPPPSTSPSPGGSTVPNDLAPELLPKAAMKHNISSNAGPASGTEMSSLPSASHSESCSHSDGNPMLTELLNQVARLRLAKSSEPNEPPVVPQAVNLIGGAGKRWRARQDPGDGIYTPMNQLSASELEQFKAETFTLGEIPLVPPPRELS